MSNLLYFRSTRSLFNEGQLIDTSFTLAPRQRNIREENLKIKSEAGDDLWNNKPNKKRHKDIDARWTKKNGRLSPAIKSSKNRYQE